MKSLSQILRPGIESQSLLLLILKLPLIPLSWIYSAYMKQRRKQNTPLGYRAPCPIISVGNLTVGGTGKTPMTAFILDHLLELKRHPAVISRGYGSSEVGELNDELAMLQQKFPSCSCLANPNRRIAIEKALTAGSNVLVLDDGFQHLAVQRDIDLVLLDARHPFGGGFCFPAGTLREPITALTAATAILLTHCNKVSTPEVDRLTSQIRNRHPETPIWHSAHRPTGLSEINGGQTVDPQSLLSDNVLAFSSIAHPGSFLGMLADLGLAVAGRRDFADHHAYTAKDIRDLITLSQKANSRILVTTEKDQPKLMPFLPLFEEANLRLLTLSIRIEMPPEHAAEFEKLLSSLFTDSQTRETKS